MRLYDAGQERGTFFYAMEYLSKGSLVDQAPPVGRRRALGAVASAARAAHALHEVGLVHRDIKPANVLLTDDGAVLSDLGLAQQLEPGMTLTGMGSIGSLEYMDPAIIRGQSASRATDIWSLGATLHWALTQARLYGELPQSDPLLSLRRVLGTPPKLSADLRPEEADLVNRCLALDEGERPRTAAALAELIDGLPS